jgi:hypothetical protein
MLEFDKDFDLFDRMQRAVQRVQYRLHRSVALLEKAGIRYAVVGAQAVNVWVAHIDESAVRNTPDVDILICRERFEDIKIAFTNAGFIYRRADEKEMFVEAAEAKNRDAVMIFFANEMARQGDINPAPAIGCAEVGKDFCVLPLEPLVTMEVTAYRTKNRVHLRDMMDVGLIDESWLGRFPPELAVRLKELLDDPDG